MPTSSLLTSTNTNSNKLDEVDLINHDLDGGGVLPALLPCSITSA